MRTGRQGNQPKATKEMSLPQNKATCDVGSCIQFSIENLVEENMLNASAVDLEACCVSWSEYLEQVAEIFCCQTVHHL